MEGWEDKEIHEEIHHLFSKLACKQNRLRFAVTLLLKESDRCWKGRIGTRWEWSGLGGWGGYWGVPSRSLPSSSFSSLTSSHFLFAPRLENLFMGYFGINFALIMVNRGEWLWRRTLKHQRSKHRCQDLCWKVHVYAMHELRNQNISFGLFLFQ